MKKFDNDIHFHEEWMRIFSENYIQSRSLQSKLYSKERIWLQKIMVVPYLAEITEIVLNKIMPRTIKVLSLRAASLILKEEIPKGFIQRLLILGNLPKDLYFKGEVNLRDAHLELLNRKYWKKIGIGWQNIFTTSHLTFNNILKNKHLTNPLIDLIRIKLSSKEKLVFDNARSSLASEASLRLIKIYKLVLLREKEYRSIKGSLCNSNQKCSIIIKSKDIIRITRRYPVIIKVIISYCNSLEKFYINLCRNISSDSLKIKNKFNTDIKNIVSISTGIGDKHIDGKSTSLIIFKDGSKLYYKPRSLAMEIAFADLIEKACVVFNIPSFRLIPKSLQIRERGYQEHVNFSFPTSKKQKELLTRRLALITVFLDLCCATDCSEENLIIKDDIPNLIDGETLFHETSMSRLKEETHDSILEIGIFHNIKPYITRIINSLTDENINSFDIYISELKRIYYNPNLKDFLYKEVNLIYKLKPKRRILFRSTSLYFNIRNQCLTPKALLSNRKLGSIIEDLFLINSITHRVRRSMVLLCQSELLQIENGWIPFFDTFISNDRINLYGGYTIKANRHKKILDISKERVINRQLGDANRQLKLVGSVFKLFPKNKTIISNPSPKSIATELLELAINKGGWKWLFFTINERVMNINYNYPNCIYEGSAGIAIFLRACREHGLIIKKDIEKCEEIENAITIENESFFFRVKENNNLKFIDYSKIGFQAGIGGKFLSLVLLSTISNNKTYFNDLVLDSLKIITSEINSLSIKQFGGLDIMSGLAGLAGGVHCWSRKNRIPKDNKIINNFWKLTTSILIESQSNNGGWEVFDEPILGFAHGSSGIMCALATANLYIKNIGINQSLERAIKFELNNLTSKDEWTDIQLTMHEGIERSSHSWCGGPTGALIAGSVIKRSGLERINGYIEWITKAKDASVKIQPERDQICCGLPGWIMAASAAGRYLDDRTLLEYSKSKRKDWILKIEETKEINSWKVQKIAINPPGLYVGRAGVGLTLINSKESAWIEDIIISCGYLIN